MNNKVLFLTGHLLNIHQAFPTHTHFKPLSENRGTHTVAIHNRVHQSYISPMTIHIFVFFSIWQTTEKKKNQQFNFGKIRGFFPLFF